MTRSSTTHWWNVTYKPGPHSQQMPLAICAGSWGGDPIRLHVWCTKWMNMQTETHIHARTHTQMYVVKLLSGPVWGLWMFLLGPNWQLLIGVRSFPPSGGFAFNNHSRLRLSCRNKRQSKKCNYPLVCQAQNWRKHFKQMAFSNVEKVSLSSCSEVEVPIAFG